MRVLTAAFASPLPLPLVCCALVEYVANRAIRQITPADNKAFITLEREVFMELLLMELCAHNIPSWARNQ
jgi:hypothetical protein